MLGCSRVVGHHLQWLSVSMATGALLELLCSCLCIPDPEKGAEGQSWHLAGNGTAPSKCLLADHCLGSVCMSLKGRNISCSLGHLRLFKDCYLPLLEQALFSFSGL